MVKRLGKAPRGSYERHDGTPTTESIRAPRGTVRRQWGLEVTKVVPWSCDIVAWPASNRTVLLIEAWLFQGAVIYGPDPRTSSSSATASSMATVEP